MQEETSTVKYNVLILKEVERTFAAELMYLNKPDDT